LCATADRLKVYRCVIRHQTNISPRLNQSWHTERKINRSSLLIMQQKNSS